MSEIQNLIDDLKEVSTNLEADLAEAQTSLKMAKGSKRTASTASKSSIGSVSNMSVKTAEAIISLMEDLGMLKHDIKIGKHPKTTGLDKEGEAKFVNHLYEIIGDSRRLTAYRSCVVVPE